MTPTTSDRYHAQRHQALERANQVRLARTELRYRIARGEVSAAEVIISCPPEAEGWRIGELLRAQWRWGDARTRRFLWRNDIWENRPVGKLSERQRRLLASALQRERGR